MNITTLYLSGFDGTTTRDEIVEVLSMSCPRLVLRQSPSAVSPHISLPTSTVHILLVGVTFRGSLALVRFPGASSAPPDLMARVIGAMPALNGSKVAPRRFISPAKSWSPHGLRVVLEPSHFGALSQYPSLKSLADSYPAVYRSYLSLDFATRLDAERGFTVELGHPEMSPKQAALDTLAAQPSESAKEDASLREELHTLKEEHTKTRRTLVVTEGELERQNAEYTIVVARISKEQKEHESTKDELKRANAEAFELTCEKRDTWRRLQDMRRLQEETKQLEKEAREELRAFMNDHRDETKLRRDAEFHERQCTKASERREQAEAEAKKWKSNYQSSSQNHTKAKAELARAKADLEQAQAENQALTTQLTQLNARVTQLESSEQNVATKTNELKRSEQRFMSLARQPTEICLAKVRAEETVVPTKEAECARSTELYKQALDAKEPITPEAANVQLGEFEVAKTKILENKQLEAKLENIEAAGDLLLLNVLNSIRASGVKKKRPLSDVLGVDSPTRQTKRVYRTLS